MTELLQLPLSKLVTFTQDWAANFPPRQRKTLNAIQSGCHPVCQDTFVAAHTLQASEPFD